MVVWWIAGGVVAAALVVLVLAVVSVLGRLRRFRDAAGTLQRRVAQATELAEAVAGTQRQLDRLQAPLEVAGRRAAALSARRGGGDA